MERTTTVLMICMKTDMDKIILNKKNQKHQSHYSIIMSKTEYHWATTQASIVQPAQPQEGFFKT